MSSPSPCLVVSMTQWIEVEINYNINPASFKSWQVVVIPHFGSQRGPNYDDSYHPLPELKHVPIIFLWEPTLPSSPSTFFILDDLFILFNSLDIINRELPDSFSWKKIYHFYENNNQWHFFDFILKRPSLHLVTTSSFHWSFIFQIFLCSFFYAS